jgi:hypothetical protein
LIKSLNKCQNKKMMARKYQHTFGSLNQKLKLYKNQYRSLTGAKINGRKREIEQVGRFS